MSKILFGSPIKNFYQIISFQHYLLNFFFSSFKILNINFFIIIIIPAYKLSKYSFKLLLQYYQVFLDLKLFVKTYLYYYITVAYYMI